MEKLEQILSFIEDKELKFSIIEELEDLSNTWYLDLKAANGCFIGDEYYYTFIFEDTLKYLKNIPKDYWKDNESCNQYRARQNQRAHKLYTFAYNMNLDSLEVPNNLHLADLDINVVQITFSFS